MKQGGAVQYITKDYTRVQYTKAEYSLAQNSTVQCILIQLTAVQYRTEPSDDPTYLGILTSLGATKLLGNNHNSRPFTTQPNPTQL